MIREDKKEQRLIIKEKNTALSRAYIESSDKAIAERLFSLDVFRKAGTIFIYVSTGREVDTYAIIEKSLACGKKVAVPRCTGKGVMDAFAISSTADLEKGAYGIYEPVGSCRRIPPSEIDRAVIPCVSCDRKCNRLGHGIGFYDRYLCNTGFTSIALCREKIMLGQAVTEPHDVPVDMVITENAVYEHDPMI